MVEREIGVGGRGKEEAPARKSLLVGASWSLLDLAKSDVFECFFVQETCTQGFAVPKSQDACREINEILPCAWCLFSVSIVKAVQLKWVLVHLRVYIPS